MGNKNSFYLQLEKVFIENQLYRQPWFYNAASQEELIELIKSHLEQYFPRSERELEITVDDVKRLLKTPMTYIAHYNKTSEHTIKMQTI